MMISYGLDLGGYTTKKTALAKAEKIGNRCIVTIIEKHVFSEPAAVGEELAKQAKKEVECLRVLMAKGNHLYCDVPIDLQGLPNPRFPEKIWQLTLRPVDYAFDALPPIADRIGSCVARMQYLLSLIGGELGLPPLGRTLFETYPAGSLKLSRNESEGKGYKGVAKYKMEGDNRSWGAATEESNETTEASKDNGGDKKGEKAKSRAARDKKLAELLKGLRWEPTTNNPGFKLTHDEFDAALCALCGVVGEKRILKGNGLRRAIETRIKTNGKDRGYKGPFEPPVGYVLLREIPQDVQIEKKDYAKMFPEGSK